MPRVAARSPQLTSAHPCLRSKVKPLQPLLVPSPTSSTMSFFIIIHSYVFYRLYMIIHLMTHDLSIIYIYTCVCHAFTTGLISYCYGYVLLHLVIVLVWLLFLCCLCRRLCVFVVVWGPCLRSSRGIMLCSIVLVMGSSCRGHNTEHNSIPHL